MKRFFAMLLACSLCLPTTAFAVSGSPAAWAQSTVDAAKKAGILPALSKNPDYADAITREQFAELIVCMIETTTGETLPAYESPFSDCNNPAVIKASNAGIVSGLGNGVFSPDTKTNREQIASMLSRAIKHLEENMDCTITPETASLHGFSDAAQVSSWAKESVGLLAANDLMKGSAGKLSPKDPCQVQQSISFVYRIYEAFQGAETTSKENKTESKPIETVKPQKGSVVYYEKYPEVPDFGAVTGLKLQKEEAYKQPFDIYTALSSSKPNDTYNYEYPFADLDTMTEYITLLHEEGFRYTNRGLSMEFRSTKNYNLKVSINVTTEKTTIKIDNAYKVAKQPKVVSYYPGTKNAPDFGACTGFKLIDTRTVKGSTIYEYERESGGYPHYIDLLFHNGYYYETSVQFGHVYKNYDTGLAIGTNPTTHHTIEIYLIPDK